MLKAHGFTGGNVEGALLLDRFVDGSQCWR
jgi:hypothetical protein